MILRAGFLVFEDRLCRLVIDASAEEDQGEFSEQDEQVGLRGWMEQFDRRGPIELSGSQVDGLIEQLASLADLPKLELPGWTGWQVESGRPQPKLVLDDSPSVKDEEQVESVDPEESLGRPKRKSRKSKSKIQLGGSIWFDYGGMQIAADDPAGGAADAARRRLVRRNKIAEREGSKHCHVLDFLQYAPDTQVPLKMIQPQRTMLRFLVHDSMHQCHN